MSKKLKIILAFLILMLIPIVAESRTYLQSWQTTDINAHSTLGVPANDGLDDMLTRIDQGLASPLRMSATVPATAVLDITASMVPGADGSYHTLGQANNTIPLYPATTINYQTVGTTGGTVQVDGTTITSSLPACMTSSPGPYYRQVFVYVSSSNLINTHFSSAATTQAVLTDPGTLFSALNGVAMGYLDLQCTASGLYKTAGSATSIIENFPTGNTLAPINNFAARVGDMAYQNAGYVAITGGTVSGAAITSSTISGNTATNLVSGSGTLTLNTTGTITVPNATDTLIGKNTTDTLTNKTLTDPVMGAYWDATEISTPASPASGVLRLYSKSGDNLYMRTSSGSEFEISNSLTNPMTTLGDTIYENSTPAPARLPGNTTSTKNFLTQTGTGSVSAAPAWGVIAAADVPVATTSANGGITIKAPTQQVFNQTNYYTFTVTTSTPTFTAGETCTNNSSTYTIVYPNTISGSTTLVAYRSAGTNAPSASGNLASCSSGTSTLAYSSVAANGDYFLPSGVLWIRVRAVGGGGGGAGASTSGSVGGSGGGGSNTTFGSSLLSAGGGGGGTGNSATFGAGGTSSLGSGPTGIALSGGTGSSGMFEDLGSGLNFNLAGGAGGASAFGGAGGGPDGSGAAGTAGATNSGGGGSGGALGGNNTGSCFGGSGGGAGGFVDAIISAPSSTYAFTVGAGGAAGAQGAGGAGGAGGSGAIFVEEHYY